MKLWHWLALAAGGLFVLYMVTKPTAPTSQGTPLQPQTGYDWLRVSGRNFNVGLKL
jgi:hypothetical protein